MLPLTTVQNLRDLTLGLQNCYYRNGAPEWPTAWGQLAGLTRLAIFGGRCATFKDANDQQKLLEFLGSLPSLKEFEASVDSSIIFGSGGELLFGLASCVPSLNKLVVTLRAKTFVHESVPLEARLQRLAGFSDYRQQVNTWKLPAELGQICDAVVRKAPGAWTSKACDHEVDDVDYSWGCVELSFNRRGCT